MYLIRCVMRGSWQKTRSTAARGHRISSLPSLRGAILVTAIMLGGGCGESSSPAGPAASIVVVVIAPTTAVLVPGQTLQLAAAVAGTTNGALNWRSSSDAVATVDGVGRVTATGPGTVTITATSQADPTRSAAATITVTPPPPPVAVTVSPVSASLTVGTTQQLVATVTESVNTQVVWSSSAAGVAGVSPTGLVTAIAVGTVTITATSVADPTRSARATVVVLGPVVVSVAPSTVILAPSQTIQLTAFVTNTGNSAVSWSSSNPGVAVVSATGLVTAVAPGTATITVTALGAPSKTATATITVGTSSTSGTLQLTIANLPTVADRTAVGVQLNGPTGRISTSAPTTGDMGSLTLSGLAPGTYMLEASQETASSPGPYGVIYSTPVQSIVITAGATTQATQTYALTSVPLRILLAGAQFALCSGLQVTMALTPLGETVTRTSNFGLSQTQPPVILFYAGVTQFRCDDQVIGGRIYRPTAALYSFTTTPSTTPYDVLVTYAPVP